MVSEFEARIRHVTAVLGPTNTGKTHLAIERMLGHESGMIGLPLRLLAREVYDKVKARVGADAVALITGEEKIKPERARYWVSTVEAMPRDVDVDFLAIDEIQLCADPERGHVFTDRLLHARGRSETLLLGAATMRDAIADLIPGANFISRPRLSKITYAGEKKITRLPARSAIVAFSAQDVYALAELIKRQRGGAAVVLGALSPRTRNAQVALYQSGDVEFLIATDAIGMGLNLDVNHIAFSALRKFDGHNHRNLTAGELGQIAGRAGRYMNDGTFGVTGGAEAIDADLVERLETHTFDPVRVLQWRNRSLDFSSLDGLHASLRQTPREVRLTRARTADDVAALEAASSDREVRDLVTSPAAVETLWDVCQVPDYRKISGQSHSELVGILFKYIAGSTGHIDEDWFSKQVAFADRTDGDIDTLATRIAHIRTWTFVSNRPDWLKDPAHWQDRTRAIEDRLSDALHERLTQRFVDRRTSALMKGMRDKDELTADISEDGAITVESHFLGRLKGFRFTPDPSSDGVDGKAMRAAAAQVLSRELGMRARRVAACQNDALKLTRNGRITWRDEEIGRIEPSDDPIVPQVVLVADETLSDVDKEKVQARLTTWLKDLVTDKLKPLADIANSADLQGLGRGVAFRLTENFGVLKRDTVADEINSLDQPARADLRRYGLRFGAFNIFFPLLLKPAAAELTATLWLLKNAAAHGLDRDALPVLPRPGLTSVAADPAMPEALYRAYGFHLCGPRAVRLDILERLADIVRPLLAWRPREGQSEPPKGSTGDGGFRVTDDMMSILGSSAGELGEVLKALGFRLDRRPIAPAKATPTAEAAANVEEAPSGAEAASLSPSLSVSPTVSPSVSPSPDPEPDADPAAINEDVSGIAAVPASEVVADGQPGAAEPAAAAEATPEATPEGAPDASAAAAVVPEVSYEDIWRPRRHQRNERPRRAPDERRDVRRPRETATAPATPSAATAASPPPPNQSAPDDRADNQTRDQRKSGERPGGLRPGGDRDRDRSGRGNRPANDARGGRESGRSGGPGSGPGSHSGRGGRDHKRGGDFKRQPEVISAAPPKRANADPDSPFAALAALRASMDKKGEGQGPR